MKISAAVDAKNIEFWNELCGSHLAKVLGVTDASPESLKKFDAWYFAIYPYLEDEIGLGGIAGKKVLEIGLGYGSLSQRIAERGAKFTGLDIASGPVAMVDHRLRQAGLPGSAIEGSVLKAPFADSSFDHVVAIGCLHHTGDMSAGINECWRMLRPGGLFTFMVYYAYSYRRWRQAPRETLRYMAHEALGFRGVVRPHAEEDKRPYDSNSKGELAPHMDFVSVRSLRRLCRNFRSFSWRRRNINQEPPFSRRSREMLLKTRWPDFVGLEIYATAVK